MDKKSFSELLEKLEGLNWCFFAGLAVSIYSGGKRKVGDVDIIVDKREIKKFAKRLDYKVKKRIFNKETFQVNDFGFTANFLDLEVEVSSGFPKKRIKEKTFKKVLNNKVKKKYLGLIEEILIHKALMGRGKDLNDLRLLSGQKINKDFLKELLNDWGKKEEVILDSLRKTGYKI